MERDLKIRRGSLSRIKQAQAVVALMNQNDKLSINKHKYESSEFKVAKFKGQVGLTVICQKGLNIIVLQITNKKITK